MVEVSENVTKNVNMPTKMPTSEKIDCVIDVIQAYGWQRGSFGPYSTYNYASGRHCIMGAHKVCALLEGEQFGYFGDYLHDEWRDAFGYANSIVPWNDFECESKDEAVAMLLTCRNRAAKRGD